MSETPAMTVPTARKRPRLWRALKRIMLVLLLTIAIGAIAGLSVRWYLLRDAEQRLAEVIAELDRSDPGWRIEDVEAARAVVPDEENSAPVVLAAGKEAKLAGIWREFARNEEHGRLPDAFQLPPYEREIDNAGNYIAAIEPQHRYSREFAALLKQELAASDKALSIIRQLTDTNRRGRYPVAYTEDAMSTQLPHATPVRELANLLRYSSGMLTHEGQFDSALADGRAAIAVARSLGDEPFLITLLVRSACVMQALGAIERTMAQGQASPESLLKTQRALEMEYAQFPRVLVQGFRGERAMYHRVCESIAAGRMSLENLSSGRDGPNADWWDQCVEWAIFRGPVRKGHRKGLEYETRMIRIGELPPKELFAGLEEFSKEVQDIRASAARGGENLLPALMLPAVLKVTDVYHKTRARMACGIAGIAAERFRLQRGRWPARIHELTPEFLSVVPDDPFSGRPLAYEVTDDGTLVYSFGLDRRDNGGKLRRSWEPEFNTDLGFRLWNPDQRAQPLPKPPWLEETKP